MGANANNKIDDLFRDKLLEYEMPAPAGAWTKIDQELGHKKRIFWLKLGLSMAASIALILTTSIGYYLGIHKTRSNSNLTRLKIQSENIRNTPSGHNYKVTPQQITSDKGIISEMIVRNSNSQVHKPVTGNYVASSAYSNSKPALSVKMSLLKLPRKVYQIIYSGSSQYILAFSNAAIDAYLIGNNSFVEDSISKNEVFTQKRWLIGSNAAPNYSYRVVQTNSTGIPTNSLNAEEKPLVAFSGGVNINYVSKRWRFESGIYYTETGQQFTNLSGQGFSVDNNKQGQQNYVLAVGNPSKVYDALPHTIQTSNGTIRSSGTLYANQILLSDNSKIDNFDKLEQKYQYIEVPLIARYKLIDKKTSVFINGGLSTNFLVNNSVYGLQSNNSKVSIGSTNAEEINYAGICGFSVEMPLTTRLNFSLEPRFRYFLNSISSDNNVNTHPYSFGIYTGLSFQF